MRCLTPFSVIVMVDGAIATDTNTHFSGGTRAYAFSIAPFSISTPVNIANILHYKSDRIKMRFIAQIKSAASPNIGGSRGVAGVCPPPLSVQIFLFSHPKFPKSHHVGPWHLPLYRIGTSLWEILDLPLPNVGGFEQTGRVSSSSICD